MLLRPAYWAGLIAITALVSHAPPASADFPLHRLWSVADDTLAVAFGTIADAAVGGDGVVYLLDSQNMCVRRISLAGVELPALGGRGEGPGEFTYPLAVTTRKGGGTGRLLLTTLTTSRAPEVRAADEAVDHGSSVFAMGPGNDAPVALFSDVAELCGTTTVRINDAGWLDRCWDVDWTGRIIYADPAGGYRVVIGHPADGESISLDLPEADTDAEGLRHLAAMAGRDPESLSRIAAVYWIGEDRFIVKPMAAIAAPTRSRTGTYELFDTRGNSYGRDELRCDYEAGHDQFFLRNGTIVIVKGGQSAIRADLSQKAALIGRKLDAPAPPDDAWDMIRVDAYAFAP